MDDVVIQKDLVRLVLVVTVVHALLPDLHKIEVTTESIENFVTATVALADKIAKEMERTVSPVSQPQGGVS